MTDDPRAPRTGATMEERARRYVPRPVRRTTRGFTLVLTLLVSSYVVGEVWDQSDTAQAIVWILAFFAIVVTLRAVGSTPRTVYVNAVVVTFMLILAIVGLVAGRDALTEPAAMAVAGYAFVAPIIILRHILQARRITMDVISGALAVYVFLGIDFAILYSVIQRVDAAAFATVTGGSASVFYLSFMTLTTVGYGDVTPVSDWAQALAVIEALTGQILLVVIVARLVGLQISQTNEAEEARP